jgi:uncharacterized protein YuzE
MKISYDPQADALNIEFRSGTVKETMEVAPGVLLDVDGDEQPLYLEILNVTEKLGEESKEEITLTQLIQPAQIQR